jgi:hypothetical protein
MKTVIVAVSKPAAVDYCREQGIPPHGRDTIIASTAEALRGFALHPENVHFVGPVDQRPDYLDILRNLDAAYAKQR